MDAPRLILDARTRWSGTTLIGGSPIRVMRLGARGLPILEAELTGRPSPDPGAARSLSKRLCAAGLAHPVPVPSGIGRETVAVVIPVHDDPGGVGSLLAGDGIVGSAEVVVVDDGSTAGRAPRVAARTLRNQTALGPAAARNRGWRATVAPFVVFVDADVSVSGRWIEELLASFTDDDVVAVAPRVRAAPGSRALDRYEEHRSPLDMGTAPAVVRPGSPVPYVPAAALVVRRDALEAVGGFDEALRYGEDVDLVWRLTALGTVRYRPDVVVGHRNRGSWWDLARQRASYGRAAAPLESRHRGAASPLVINRWSALAWGGALVGGRRGALGGVLVALGSTTALARRLRGHVPDPLAVSVRIAGLGNLAAGRWIAEAARRAWWPVLFVAAPLSRRVRRLTVAIVLAPPLASWFRRRPRLDPLRWTVACALDDGAYALGAWRGCVRERSVRALLPRLRAGEREPAAHRRSR
ncbi:MAG: mycofactocin biosynthesis glycosyltransferase MftF [Acidimicrobiales bacterium]